MFTKPFKPIFQVTVFALIIIISHSCSIEKRHYRKGWFVSGINKVKKENHLCTSDKHIINLKQQKVNDIAESKNEVINLTSSSSGLSRANFMQNNPSITKPIHTSSRINTDTLLTKKEQDTRTNGTQKQLLRSKIAFWISIAFNSLIIIGPLFVLVGLPLQILILFNIGWMVSFFVLLSGWLLIPIVFILSQKEAKQQRKEFGRMGIIKMLRTGEYSHHKALFARRLMWVSFIIYLLILSFLFTIAALGIVNS